MEYIAQIVFRVINIKSLFWVIDQARIFTALVRFFNCRGWEHEILKKNHYLYRQPL